MLYLVIATTSAMSCPADTNGTTSITPLAVTSVPATTTLAEDSEMTHEEDEEDADNESDKIAEDALQLINKGYTEQPMGTQLKVAPKWHSS